MFAVYSTHTHNAWNASFLLCSDNVCILRSVQACSTFCLSVLEESFVKNDQEFWKRGLACGCVGLMLLCQRHYQSDLIRHHILVSGGGWGEWGEREDDYQFQMGFISQHLSSPSESLPKMQRAISITSLNVSITSLGGWIRSRCRFNQSSLG